MANKQNIKINAVVYEEGGMWVAHCLEYSFVSYTENLDDLPNELLSQVREQIEANRAAGQQPFEGFKRAPQKYWDMFEQAKGATPLKPEKTLVTRCLELVNGSVQAQLFPVVATATA